MPNRYSDEPENRGVYEEVQGAGHNQVSLSGRSIAKINSNLYDFQPQQQYQPPSMSETPPSEDTPTDISPICKVSERVQDRV